ncbi:glycosyltransferase family 4 protein [Nocardioides terrigena]|uniref:glycosyltransferase family 4 protein n=1 Tax=Nocardioides terrigena TaxID=424797 RepID=UPI000D2FAC42|nr:glycosyltransferase family 4 protein [Nocardioides terrigena]
MSDLRLLVVYPHLPHYRDGVFRSFANRPEMDVSFAAASESKDPSIETIPLSQFNSVELVNRWFGPALWQRGLILHLLRNRYDAVVFLGDVKYLSTWASALLLRLLRRKVIFWTIGWHKPDRYLAKWLRLAFYRLAHSLALYGEVGRQIGVKAGYPQERMHVIGNSVSSSAKDQCPEWSSPDLADLREWRVLMVGRLTSVKNLPLVIQAIAGSARLARRTSVLFVGDGPEREALADLAAEYGVDARFLGAIYSDEALAQVYREAHVTVVPGAAGLTVIQSLEHGVPVITHDSPFHQMPEAEAVVPGRTGATYRYGDVADLGRRMEEWTEILSGGAGEYADLCRQEVRTRWSPEVHADRLADVVRGARPRVEDTG